MAIAGKVAITLSTENGGAWSADVTYDRLVAVKHNNNLYISRKTVANVEPPNDEFWFLALEGFGGDDVQALIDRMNELSDLIQAIIDGTTQVGNAKTLDGHEAEEFFPKSGGTLTGDLSIAKHNNGSTKFIKNHSASADYGTRIYDVASDGKQAGFGWSAGSKTPYFTDSDGKSSDLLHTGNKPTGTYTGNGSATERKIATNGIGNAVMVFGQNGTMAIVSARGTICADETGVRFFGRTNGAYKLADGNIYMNSADKALNEMGITYQWQEL